VVGHPFAAAVEEVAEEEDGVGCEAGLEGFVGAAEVVVCVLLGEGAQRPGPAGVGVWVDELRVGYEDEMMRCGFSWLREEMLAGACF
jgi:hypothetical protein